MGGKPHDQVTDQILSLFTPVEWFKPIEFFQELIDEPGTGDEIVAASLGN